jgi:hypothetical protein
MEAEPVPEVKEILRVAAAEDPDGREAGHQGSSMEPGCMMEDHFFRFSTASPNATPLRKKVLPEP